jgi:hypothetical protein
MRGNCFEKTSIAVTIVAIQMFTTQCLVMD